MISYGLLVSGALGHQCLLSIKAGLKINFVLTDRNSSEIISFCKAASIPHYIGNPRGGKGAAFVEQWHADVILSINYLFIIESDLIRLPRLAINFHGSLLPKYRGRTPHVWAIINNEKETGITAHLINEACDAGAILHQEKIEIPEDDTGGDILNKFKLRFPVAVQKVVALIESDSVKFRQQDESMATFFEKRSPEDGAINWEWQKERIRNWVRALAHPYPGAFTDYHGSRVIINKMKYSSFGFKQSDENGKILDMENAIIVKTPNGAVELVEYSIEQDKIIKKGEVFR